MTDRPQHHRQAVKASAVRPEADEQQVDKLQADELQADKPHEQATLPTGNPRRPDAPADAQDPAVQNMPHERDESVDATAGAPIDAQVRRGFHDVRRGLIDTDERNRAAEIIEKAGATRHRARSRP